MLPKLLTGDGGLAEGDSAVVGRNFAVEEDFESVVAQSVEAAFEKDRVLEASATQADAVELKIRAHAAADFRDDSNKGRVEASGEAGPGFSGFDVGEDLVDHRTQVDVDWIIIVKGEIVSIG